MHESVSFQLDNICNYVYAVETRSEAYVK